MAEHDLDTERYSAAWVSNLRRDDLLHDEALLWDGAGVLRRDPIKDDGSAKGHGAERRTIRAVVVKQMLLHDNSSELHVGPFVWIQHADIEGDLDLTMTTVTRSLYLQNCQLKGALSIHAAEIPSLVVDNVSIAGRLYADLSRISRRLSVTACDIAELASFNFSTIDGPASFCETHFSSRLQLTSLTAAEIDCTRVHFPDRSRTSINARLARVQGDVRLGDDPKDASAPTADSDGVHHEQDAPEPTVTARSADRSTRRVVGTVDLGGATINGDLDCSGVEIEGGLNLLGATINGALTLESATIDAGSGTALMGQLMTVGNGLYARPGFRAIGSLDIRSAEIGGQVSLDGACLELPALSKPTNADTEHPSVEDRAQAFLRDDFVYSLRADRAQVGDSVFCRDGFKASGAVSFTHCNIERALSLKFSDFAQLFLDSVTASELVLLPTSSRFVTVEGASVGLLWDLPNTWPANRLISGLSYQRLRWEWPLQERLEWLRKSGYVPSAYDLLTEYLRRAGEGDRTWRVQCAKQDHRREESRRQRSALLHEAASTDGTQSEPNRLRSLGRKAQVHSANFFSRLWQAFAKWTIGYGYRPLRVVPWLVTVLTASTLLFGPLGMGDIVPSDADRTQPAFNALLYSADVLLPIVDLRVARLFIPSGFAEWLASLLTLAGWLFGVTLVAGVSGVFGRE